MLLRRAFELGPSVYHNTVFWPNGVKQQREQKKLAIEKCKKEENSLIYGLNCAHQQVKSNFILI